MYINIYTQPSIYQSICPSVQCNACNQHKDQGIEAYTHRKKKCRATDIQAFRLGWIPSFIQTSILPSSTHPCIIRVRRYGSFMYEDIQGYRQTCKTPCVHPSINPCLHACMHACIQIYIYVCVCVYIYVCISVIYIYD